ncbi:MAG TPA: PIG-L family deacetylase [Bryobacteraceae bacterium]|nr:PIG-L family deacetylase [Bryobacteraceae bacterium]
MRNDSLLPTRKDFLRAVAGTALLARPLAGASGPKILMVVAHPDDEYAFAATTYRLVRELGWSADQVVITNGESGYRYSALAEAFYGMTLADERNGRARLPDLRKEEAIRAGKILGIRQHYFLDQRDLGFSRDAATADASNWDRPHLLAVLGDLLARERYHAVFTLLPTVQTHGHHRAATILALEAAARLPEDQRPLFFGVEPQARANAPLQFGGLPSQPLTATQSAEPVLTFDRATPFSRQAALNYQVVVNWVIAEHKSQGLFQMDAGQHDLERFWLFAVSGGNAVQRVSQLRAQLSPPLHTSAARQ